MEYRGTQYGCTKQDLPSTWIACPYGHRSAQYQEGFQLSRAPSSPTRRNAGLSTPKRTRIGPPTAMEIHQDYEHNPQILLALSVPLHACFGLGSVLTFLELYPSRV